MSLRPSLMLAALCAAVLAAPAAARADAPPKLDSCFLARDWDGWTAPGDGDAILVRVRLHDVYRIELSPGSHVRKEPDRFLVNQIRGSEWICSPLDLDLKLADHVGFEEPLIARSIRKLSPEEVAALPKKDRP